MADVRELRLGLVCYGGSSLAIYMHGVTKEIQKLVVASVAFERDQGTNPFDPDDTARLYWDLLSRLRFGDDGPSGGQVVAPRTRVVVDIVSGTSAGGINGICLAKALARNRSQDALRDVWFEEGDIRKLLRGPSWLPAGLRFLGYVARSLVRPLNARPPLRGDEMCRLLYKAFADMDGDRPVLGGLDSDTLVPAGQRLDLYVPITDFHGYGREILLEDPRRVLDRTHRHVMAFGHDTEANGAASHFAPPFNHGLGFAARATASFPGMFDPVSFDTYAAAFGKPRQLRKSGIPDAPRPRLGDLVGNLFPDYKLAGVAADGAFFMDGGVLDNFPFRTTIEAIAARSASTEVDRWLLYVEPDPGDGADTSSGKPPTWHGTIWGGYAAIPRKEPVLDDFLRLAERNRTVARVRDIIETNFEDVSAEVGRLVTGALGELPPRKPSGAELVSWFQRVERQAAQHTGFAYGSYLSVRSRDVVDGYAALVSSLLEFSKASYHASFVGNVLRAWAKTDRLLKSETTPADPEAQRTFLAQHDLAYTERRIQFLIAAVNWWYRDVGRAGFPTRDQLDRAKERLYERVAEVRAIKRAAADDDTFVMPLKELFDPDEVRKTVLATSAAESAFVEQHKDVLVGLREGLRKQIESAVPPIMERLHGDLLQMMDEWTPEVAGALLTRYLGFAYWDVLTYPLEALSGVYERDHVETVRLSPADVSLLAKKGEKPEDKLYGAKLAHFGAFFSRRGREQDYLWGRLDAAERLVTLLLDDPERPGLTPPDFAACRPVFEAILADEAGLKHAQGLRKEIQDRMERRGRQHQPSVPSPAV